MSNLVVPKGTETAAQKEINETGRMLLELDMARREAEILLVKANTDCAVLEREFKRVKLFKLMSSVAKDFRLAQPIKDRIAHALAVTLVTLTGNAAATVEKLEGDDDKESE